MTLPVLRIEPVVRNLPSGFEDMRAAARGEGYGFLERLANAWESGAMRFERDGETLLAAYSAGVLAGVGGLTIEPVIPRAADAALLYPCAVPPYPDWPKVGHSLALDQPRRNGVPVTVNAAAGSTPFWESLGFMPDSRDGHTHVLLPGK